MATFKIEFEPKFYKREKNKPKIGSSSLVSYKYKILNNCFTHIFQKFKENIIFKERLLELAVGKK